MSWVFGFRCPQCGQEDEGMHVNKTENLKEWGLTCTSPLGCGYVMENGSYWLTEGPTIEEGWISHCKKLGWDPNE